MVPPCVYRDLSDEGFRVDFATGKEQMVDVWLCSWPTTLGARPPWVQQKIGAGLAITPKHDCINCPVRKAA